jgi:hypothetical protein
MPSDFDAWNIPFLRYVHQNDHARPMPGQVKKRYKHLQPSRRLRG